MLNDKNILCIGGDILKKFMNQNKHKKVLTTKREVLFYTHNNEATDKIPEIENEHGYTS